ncbi:MAG: PEGA domain-containing protein, partial [Deltaproteobacteria bacterium]|nr:PEGA domain-containing protein [Deltaproteobacteria bacterium]
EAQLGHPLIAEESSGPSDIARATARKTARIAKQEMGDLQQAPTRATVPGRSRTSSNQRYDMAATTTDVSPAASESGMTSVVARLRSRLGISLAAALALLTLVAVAIWFASKPNDAAAAQGRIVVNTTPPGATVYVDGVPATGTTPTVISNLPIGRTFVIKVELFGYEPKQQEVLTIEGRPVEFTTALTKSSGTFGIVKFVSRPPGAKVYIDGSQQSQLTPLDLPGLKVGAEHTAVFMLDGYQDATEKFKASEGISTVTVDLVKRGAVDLKVDAAVAPPPVADGKLDLDSTPRGVMVIHDGKELGLTPLKGLPFPAGEHVFKFVDERRGIDAEETVTVVAGKLARLAPKLSIKTVTVKPRSGKGVLKVVVKGNWADVYVNGKKIGQTPIPAQTLEAGVYKVRLVNPEIGKDVVKTVRIEPNREFKITERW